MKSFQIPRWRTIIGQSSPVTFNAARPFALKSRSLFWTNKFAPALAIILALFAGDAMAQSPSVLYTWPGTGNTQQWTKIFGFNSVTLTNSVIGTLTVTETGAAGDAGSEVAISDGANRIRETPSAGSGGLDLTGLDFLEFDLGHSGAGPINVRFFVQASTGFNFVALGPDVAVAPGVNTYQVPLTGLTPAQAVYIRTIGFHARDHAAVGNVTWTLREVRSGGTPFTERVLISHDNGTPEGGLQGALVNFDNAAVQGNNGGQNQTGLSHNPAGSGSLQWTDLGGSHGAAIAWGNGTALGGNTFNNRTTDLSNYETMTVRISAQEIAPDAAESINVSAYFQKNNFAFQFAADGQLPTDGQFHDMVFSLAGLTNMNVVELTGINLGDHDGNLLINVDSIIFLPPACVNVPPNLIGWWPGDGNARDIWGVHNGTLVGNASFGTGEVKQAFSFDGTGDRVELGDVDLSATFTIDAWIAPANLTNDPRIISKDDGVATRSYDFHVAANGSLIAEVFSGLGDPTTYATDHGVITTDSFQHVAVTYDGSAGKGEKLRFYVNGVRVRAEPVSGRDGGGTPADTAIPANIGALGSASQSFTSGFRGGIDEVELFSRALSEPEVQAIFDAGAVGKCKPVIYVSNVANERVEQFDISGNPALFTNAGLINPAGLAFGPDDKLYVVSTNNSTIQKFGADGIPILFADSADGVSGPRGIAFDRDGNLYVANGGNNTIRKLDPAGNGTLFADSGDGLSGPYGLAFDFAGNLYVANVGSNSVRKFDPAGNATLFADGGDGLSLPIGLAFDRSGNLYVSNFNGDTITKVTPGGASSAFASASSGLDGPWGLAFDQAGNLYVVNYRADTITKFDTSGNGTLFANSGLDDPTFIALSPSALPTGASVEITSISRLGNGQVALQGFGVPFAAHSIESSWNLNANSFGPLDPVTPDSLGVWNYEDADAVGLSMRFYRLVLP